MHVHVNVLNHRSPGERLSGRSIIAIWMAYAKYQLVIDEMLSPSRVGNRYARRLFLGTCKPSRGLVKCHKDPCGCNRLFFNQMHTWLSTAQSLVDPLTFCNTIIGVPGSNHSK